MEVFWNEQLSIGSYPVDISIEASDRNNLLVDLMGIFAQLKVNVTSISAKSNYQTLRAIVQATILVSDAKRLSDIFNVLQNVSGVYEVKRIIH